MWMIDTAIGLGSVLGLAALYLWTCIRVLNEYERGVIFRLGRALPKPKGPGLIMVFLANRQHDARGLTNHNQSH